MLRLVGLVIFIAISGPAFAEERGKQRTDVCDQDSSSCRGLALEVAKAVINDAINDARIMAREGSFLCPADNPQCCPPHLKQMCAGFRAETVASVRAQLLHSAKSKKCPFVESICDMLAGKYAILSKRRILRGVGVLLLVEESLVLRAHLEQYQAPTEVVSPGHPVL